MTQYTGWFYHVPSQIANPVPSGYWVKVIDNEGNLLEGWSEEFDWSWKVDPLGNIVQFSVRQSKGFDMLKVLVDTIPEKGRTDILIGDRDAS
jgi:hypothetical protein